MPTYVYIDTYIHTHMHTHTYIQRTSRVATSVLSGRLVLAKVQADQKKRIITGSEYSSPPPSQTRFCRKATPLACKRNTLDKKTSLNISFGTGGSIILETPKKKKITDLRQLTGIFRNSDKNKLCENLSEK